MTNEEKLEIFKKVKAVLYGIDMTECENKAGWWETSVGSRFGWRKLQELQEIILAEEDQHVD